MASGRGLSEIVLAQLGALNFFVWAVANSMSSTQAVRSDAVFERYAQFPLAKTAHSRPPGPKGEEYFTGSGKLYRGV